VLVVDAVRRAQRHLCISCEERRTQEMRHDIRSVGWTSYGPGDIRYDEK